MQEQVFLATVGDAELFEKVDGKPVLFASAHTLTDSSVNLSVSAEEIRGGRGAQLLGQFFHTSQFGCTLTDTMFKLEYVAAQVGRNLEAGGDVLYEQPQTELTVEGENKVIKLNKTPVAIISSANPVVWYKVAGDESAKFVYHELTNAEVAAKAFTPVDSMVNPSNEYCVKYLVTEQSAKKLIVDANFAPKEFILVMVTDLFAGSGAFPESGRKIGTVTVKIPRFKLNGTMDLSMAMASAATVQLQGTALAYANDCNGARYAEMTEFIMADLYKDYSSIILDAETSDVGDTPVFYAVKSGKTPAVIPEGATIYVQLSTEKGFEDLKTAKNADNKQYIEGGKIAVALPDTAVYAIVYTNYQGEEVNIPASAVIPTPSTPAA